MGAYARKRSSFFQKLVLWTNAILLLLLVVIYARLQTAGKVQQTRGLFDGVSYAKLASLVSQGYTVKTTQLSEEFSYEQFLNQYQNEALVLFVMDGREHIHPVKAMDDLEPEDDWVLISLVPPQPQKERKERASDSDDQKATSNGEQQA